MTSARRSHDSYPTCPPSLEDVFLGDDIFGLYRHDTMRNPRTSDEQVLALVQLIQEGVAASQRLAEAKRMTHDRRTALTEVALLGMQARNDLVVANTGLVFQWAERNKNRGMDKLDLIQEGNLGLIRAAELYDPNNKKKASFGHYATTWIRSKMGKAIHEKGRAIRIPEEPSATLQKMHTIEREYGYTHEGLTMSSEALLGAVNEGRKKKLTAEDLAELRASEWDMDSLNREIEGNDGSMMEMGAAVSDPTEPTVEEKVIARVDDNPLTERVEKMLANSNLTPLQRDVVWLYFAEGQEPETVAQLLGKSKASIVHTARFAIMQLQRELATDGPLASHRKEILEAME